MDGSTTRLAIWRYGTTSETLVFLYALQQHGQVAWIDTGLRHRLHRNGISLTLHSTRVGCRQVSGEDAGHAPWGPAIRTHITAFTRICSRI